MRPYRWGRTDCLRFLCAARLACLWQEENWSLQAQYKFCHRVFVTFFSEAALQPPPISSTALHTRNRSRRNPAALPPLYSIFYFMSFSFCFILSCSSTLFSLFYLVQIFFILLFILFWSPALPVCFFTHLTSLSLSLCHNNFFLSLNTVMLSPAESV